MDGVMKFEPFLLYMLRDDEDAASKTMIINRGAVSLHDAVECGDFDLVKSLITDGCEVDAVDKDGNTPLHLASKFPGRILVIGMLLETDTSVLLTNKVGKSAAEILIRDSRVESLFVLSKLLEKLKKECGNDSLSTAKKLIEFDCSLSQAINLEDTAVTKYMLDNGCDVNQRVGDGGFTALHWAVTTSDIEHVKLLLNYGADVNIENYLGHRKPVDLLEIEKDESVEILKLLIDHGASLLDKHGNFVYDDFIKYGTKKFINALIRIYKPDFNRKVSSGETLLHLLVSNNKFDPIEELQGQQLKIETIRYVDRWHNNVDSTTLIEAAYNGHVRTVEFLLENGAEVHHTDYDEHSALSGAFCETYRLESKARIDLNLKCIEILLQHGADAEWMAMNRYTLFDIVLGSKHFILIKPVLAHLVLIEALGSKLRDYILIKINSYTFFRSYFDSCKRKIGKMKKNISRSVSLFDIITKSEEKMIDFARNKGLVRKLELIAYSNRRSKLYYHKILRKRIAKLHEISNLRDKALNVLSRIEELCSNRVVLEEIIGYFSYKDLQVIAKV